MTRRIFRSTGTTLKLGGGQHVSVSRQPLPKTKNSPDSTHCFFVRAPSSRAKTNKNKNERHCSLKLWSGAPTGPKLFGKLPPLPPGPASLRILSLFLEGGLKKPCTQIFWCHRQIPGDTELKLSGFVGAQGGGIMFARSGQATSPEQIT